MVFLAFFLGGFISKAILILLRALSDFSIFQSRKNTIDIPEFLNGVGAHNEVFQSKQIQPRHANYITGLFYRQRLTLKWPFILWVLFFVPYVFLHFFPQGLVVGLGQWGSRNVPFYVSWMVDGGCAPPAPSLPLSLYSVGVPIPGKSGMLLWNISSLSI